MATLPAFLKKNEAPAGAPPSAEAVTRSNRARVERDPYHLRALPHESVFFYCKRIDNSRLVRETDPKSRGACWSAIGAPRPGCCLTARLRHRSSTLAGYKAGSPAPRRAPPPGREPVSRRSGGGAAEPRTARPAGAPEQSCCTVLGPGLSPGGQARRRGRNGQVRIREA
jgi:hypothetical protein